MKKKEHLFYDVEILRDKEQKYIESLLIPFKKRPVNEQLKKEIWELLQQEKHRGTIKIPFKLALRKDPMGKFPNYIEVILDTKV